MLRRLKNWTQKKHRLLARLFAKLGIESESSESGWCWHQEIQQAWLSTKISTDSMRKYALSTLNMIDRNTELLQTFRRSQIQDSFRELFPVLHTGASNGPCITLNRNFHVFASEFWLRLCSKISEISNNWSQLSLLQTISKKDHFASRKFQSEVLCIGVRFLALWRSGRWRHLPFPATFGSNRRPHASNRECDPPWCERAHPAWRYKSIGPGKHLALTSALKQYLTPSTIKLSPLKGLCFSTQEWHLTENISMSIRTLPPHNKRPSSIAVDHVSALNKLPLKKGLKSPPIKKRPHLKCRPSQ